MNLSDVILANLLVVCLYILKCVCTVGVHVSGSVTHAGFCMEICMFYVSIEFHSLVHVSYESLVLVSLISS